MLLMFLNNLFILIILPGAFSKYYYAPLDTSTTFYEVDPGSIVVGSTLNYENKPGLQAPYPKPQYMNIKFSDFTAFDKEKRLDEYDVYFDQFLIGNNEYLQFTDDYGLNVFKRSQDIIHRGTHAYLRGSSSLKYEFTYDNTMQINDNFNHTGLRLFLQKRDPSGRWCDASGKLTITLDDVEPYFLTSFSYPDLTETKDACTFTIQTTKKVRVLLYDFQLKDDGSEYIKIDGTILYGNGQRTSTLLKGFLTEDLPVAYYYDTSSPLTISVSPLNVAKASSQFFIKLTPFESDSNDKSRDNCINESDNLDAVQDTWTNFGLKSYPKTFYNSNEYCRWSIKDMQNPNYRAVIELEFESEYCCDVLTMYGFDPYDYWTYQGFQSRKLIYAASATNVSLIWESDYVQTAVGFSGRITYQDCTCSNKQINFKLGDTPATISSPGYQKTDLTYCPNLNCNWDLTYDDNSYLRVHVNYFLLRQLGFMGKTNTLQFSDSFGNDRLQLNSNSQVGKGSELFFSSGSNKMNFISDIQNVFKVDNLARGFEFTFEAVPFKILKKVSYALSQASPQLIVDDTVSGRLMTIKATKGPIHIYAMKRFLTQTTLFDVYQGDLISTNLIDSNYFFTDNAYSLSPKPYVINGTSATIRIFETTGLTVHYTFLVIDGGLTAANNDGALKYILNNQTSNVVVNQQTYLGIYDYSDSKVLINGMEFNGNSNNITFSTFSYANLSYNGISPKFVYGNGLILNPNGEKLEVEVTPIELTSLVEYKLTDKAESHTFYSRDYYSKVQKGTSLNFITGSQEFAIKLHIIEFHGEGTIDLKLYYFKDIYAKRAITKDNFEKVSLSFCGTELDLVYDYPQTSDTSPTGFFGYYEKSSEVCTPKKEGNGATRLGSSSVTTFIISFTLFVYFKLMCR